MISMAKNTPEKKTWFPGTIVGGRRSDSFSSSITSTRHETEAGRGTALNPKLLEMVIKTINKRPGIAEEFQQGLAKTATKTWNTHLTERKRLTKKQKVVEDIASNLGLSKGFKTQFQDEAERLVSILFKEIGKRRAKEEEITSEDDSDSEEEEESDQSIPSFVEIQEPEVPIPPKKKEVRAFVKPHDHIKSPYVTIRHRSEMQTAVEDEPAVKRKFGLSFINVTKLNVKSKSSEIGEEKSERHIIQQNSPETKIKKSEIYDRKPKETKKRKFVKKGFQVKAVTPDTSKAIKVGDTIEKKVKQRPARPSNLRKYLEIKPLVELRKHSRGTEQQPITVPGKAKERLPRTETSPWDRSDTIYRNIIRITSELDTISGVRASISRRRSVSTKWRTPDSSKGSQKKRANSSTAVEFDEKTKEYLVQQIKNMLNMLITTEKKEGIEIHRKWKQERKSILVLWKDYFDIRRSDNIVQETVAFQKIYREEMMKEVDLELMQRAIYCKLARLIGIMDERSPYEQMLWEHLKSRAKQIIEDKERIKDKQELNVISILEQNARKSQTPKNIHLESERRRKVIEDHLVSLKPPGKKYGEKRQNTKETTMEEILQMRGFRGPPRNSKNTIWVRKPDFIGYLKPMKRKPKTVYDPSQPKLSKRDPDNIVENVPEETTNEELSESDSYSFIVNIERPEAVVDRKVVSKPPIPVDRKRPKPCVEPIHGFYKYFGYLENPDDCIVM